MSKMPYKTDEERKSHSLHLRMNDEELERLEDLCTAYGKTRSAMILYLITKEYQNWREMN